MIVSTNPATLQVNGRFPLSDAAAVEQVLDGAVRAQRSWRETSPDERAQLLRHIATALREGSGNLSRLITEEMGKPIAEAEGEIAKCAMTCDFYADNAVRFLSPEYVQTSAAESMIVGDPLGVVLAIMPWNYPFWQTIRCLAPALLGGNALVLKHANNVVQCAMWTATVLERAGAPSGLLGVLYLENEEIERVIRDPRIAAVSLTGSTRVGRIVGAQAASELKPQVLELGGSDPYIVLADADVDLAAEVAARARFSNAGQSCLSPKRFIVVPEIADRFVERLLGHVAALRLGDPMQRDTTLGPLARADLRDELDHQVKATIAAGATLLTGGGPADRTGHFYHPTVLDHVTEDMVAFREETFGPVGSVVRARDADDAIRLANRSDFGLGASIWTRDLDAARHHVRRIEAGAVFVNAMVASDPRVPFGGIKRSGYGRELGLLGVRSFMNVKTVWIAA